MTPLEITIGPGAPWWELAISTLAPAVIAAGAALLGVGLTERRAAKRQQAEVAERQNARDLDRGLSALAVAEHLEDFVIHCADVASSAWAVIWNEPNKYDHDYGGATPVWLKELPDWPGHVDWRHVGFDLAVRASNFRRQVQFEVEAIRGALEHLDGEDLHPDVGDAAVKVGLAAWSIAEDVRTKAGLAKFEWPENWSAVETLLDCQRRRDEVNAKRAAAGAVSDLL